jgi:hypothetical protein
MQAIFVLVYFWTIKQPYDSQICSTSRDAKDRTTVSDSGISENGNYNITSRSSSSTSLAEQSEVSNTTVVVDERTPLLMSRSLDREDGFSVFGRTSSIHISEPAAATQKMDFSPSFGSFPEILKTVSITGAGAVEV